MKVTPEINVKSGKDDFSKYLKRGKQIKWVKGLWVFVFIRYLWLGIFFKDDKYINTRNYGSSYEVTRAFRWQRLFNLLIIVIIIWLSLYVL